MMCNAYETLLFNVKNYFNENKRTNDELKTMLGRMFEYNHKSFMDIAKMYDGKNDVSIFDRIHYELKQVENYKRMKFGDDICKNQ